MSHPTPVRFSDDQRLALKNAQQATGTRQADVIRLAVEELFKKYPTNAALVQAIIIHRTAKAEKYDAENKASARKAKTVKARR